MLSVQERAMEQPTGIHPSLGFAWLLAAARRTLSPEPATQRNRALTYNRQHSFLFIFSSTGAADI